MMILTEQQILAIKRKRGELNISVAELSKRTGISRWTLDNIFKRDHTRVNLGTFEKLNNWIIEEYTK